MTDKIIVKENDINLKVTEVNLTRNLNNDYNNLTNKPDLNAFLSPDNIIQGNNIILEKNGNNITINSSGGGSGSISNIGDGVGVYKDSELGLVLLKSIKSEDSIIEISDNTETNTIDFNINYRNFNSAVSNNLEGIDEQLTLLQTSINNAETEISTNTSNISTNTSDISSLKNRMTTAESNITTNTTNISNNTSAISTNTSDISNLQSKVLPSGGTTGQVLQKVNGTDYNVTWETPSSSVSEGSGSGGINASNVYSKNGLAVNTTGTRNNAFGYNSLLSNTTGNDNIAIGYSALQNNISNNKNVAIGSYALMDNTQNSNIAIGFQALRFNTTGQQNTAIGYSASYQVTTGQQNTVVGYLNNTANTTGGWNTIVGTNNNNNNTKGSINTIVGCDNVTTLNDTANNKPQIVIGNGNLKALIGGSVGAEYNIAIGWSCLLTTTLGRNNIAIGQSAMVYNNTGEESVAIGKLSFSNGGSKNTGLGFNSGNNGTYTNSTAIGAYTLQTNQTVSNVTAIGYQADVTGSNQIQLGNSGTTPYSYGTLQIRSDERDKTDIKDLTEEECTQLIMGVKPKKYKYDYRDDYVIYHKDEDGNLTIEYLEKDGSKKRNRDHFGVLAQDIEKLIEETGLDFPGYQDHLKNGGKDVKTIGYQEFTSPMIVLIKKHENKIKELEDKISQLENLINSLINK